MTGSHNKREERSDDQGCIKTMCEMKNLNSGTENSACW
jgi:hypothetical protein